MKYFFSFFSVHFLLAINTSLLQSQVIWQNVDSFYQPLPKNFHVYKTTDSLDGKPFIAYYAEATLKDKHIIFDTDTTYKRRLTPQQFYTKNNQPLLVVNGTFFSFATNQNLNVVIKDGKVISHTTKKIKSTTDTSLLIDKKMVRGAIGISKKGKADVAWIQTDSSNSKASSSQIALNNPVGNFFRKIKGTNQTYKIDDNRFTRWKVKTAIGGGPVLLQHGEIKISNEEEQLFVGKAINDKHPRTCIGYTKDGKFIVMVIQGRFAGIADGATLTQEAQLLKDLGCVEALNLDGGGSSCMLINGKETIKPSDKDGQRPVPAVFIIKQKL